MAVVTDGSGLISHGLAAGHPRLRVVACQVSSLILSLCRAFTRGAVERGGAGVGVGHAERVGVGAPGVLAGGQFGGGEQRRA